MVATKFPDNWRLVRTGYNVPDLTAPRNFLDLGVVLHRNIHIGIVRIEGLGINAQQPRLDFLAIAFPAIFDLNPLVCIIFLFGMVTGRISGAIASRPELRQPTVVSQRVSLQELHVIDIWFSYLTTLRGFVRLVILTAVMLR